MKKKNDEKVVKCSILLLRAQIFHDLAQEHRVLAVKFDNAKLSPKHSNYELGKAAAYEVCSDTLKQIAIA